MLRVTIWGVNPKQLVQAIALKMDDAAVRCDRHLQGTARFGHGKQEVDVVQFVRFRRIHGISVPYSLPTV